MLGEEYKLEYLPLFDEELADAVNYIAHKLRNPQAARELIDRTEAVILERRWREISKIQEILGAMTDEERKEFDAAIAQGDVELCADETGKTNSIPLDH